VLRWRTKKLNEEVFEMQQQLRAVVYGRLSKEDAQSDSIEDQLQRCVTYAIEQGWQVVDFVPKIQ
jgi:predicted site-specific integrase-resolvase